VDNAQSIVLVAWGIGYTEGVEEVVDDHALLRRIRKVRDFYLAVRRLVKKFVRLPYCYSPRSVSIREVGPSYLLIQLFILVVCTGSNPNPGKDYHSISPRYHTHLGILASQGNNYFRSNAR
jgi:hypothetical protein